MTTHPQTQYCLKIALLLLIAALFSVTIYSFPPIHQDPAYHLFADNRPCCSLNNCMDVISNTPFVLFGIYGLYFVFRNSTSRKHFNHKNEITIWGTFFLGSVLIGMGSAYYHFAPNNQTLLWDRLPMTISFMALFSAVLTERLKTPFVRRLFLPLLILGIFSVLYWEYTESIGEGDLRLYFLVQFFPLVAIPLLCSLFPPQYSGFRYIGLTLLSYVLAKLCEYFDHQLYEFFQGTISGHSLKHLVASLSIVWIILYLRQRETSS